MTAHTPGPWGFEGELVFSDSHLAGRGNIVCLNPALKGLEHSAKRWEANARLIAAAPDLLAFITEWLSRQGNDANYMTEKARAAIAKAKGESDGR